MSDNKNIETKLQALGQSVEINRNFTQSVMQQVISIPKPQVKSTNRFWRLIMEKPVRTLISSATAAAILIILMVILPGTNNGIVLADVLANFNSAKIIKMNVVGDMGDGQEVTAEYWLDVNNQIIVMQTSTGIKSVADLNNRTQKMFINGVKQSTQEIPDEVYETMKFDGDMVKWIFKIFGKAFPGIETDIEKWNKVSQDDKQLVVNFKIDNQSITGDITLTINTVSKNLSALEMNNKPDQQAMQKAKITFEYPESMPEITAEEAKLNTVIDAVKSLATSAQGQSAPAHGKAFKITGKLTDENGKPIKGILYGLRFQFNNQLVETNESGEFVDSYDTDPFYQENEYQHIFAFNQDRSLGGVIWLQKKDNGKNFDLVLKPTYDIVGRLEYIDDTIKKKAEVNLSYFVEPKHDTGGHRSYCNISKILIEPDGNFRVDNIPVGIDLMLSVSGDIIEPHTVEIMEYKSANDYDTGVIKVEYQKGFGPDTTFDTIITGKVVDENGKPFWDASVVVEAPGKFYYYKTNYKGEFSTDKMPSNTTFVMQILHAEGYGSFNYFAYGPLSATSKKDWYYYVPHTKSDEFGNEVLISDRYAKTGNYQIEITGKDQLLITLKPIGNQYIGKPLPEFNFQEWWTGEPTTLANHKGKVVLLYLGLNITYSQGFKERVNTLMSVYDKYHQQGLEVIASHQNLDSEVDQRRINIKALNLPFPVAFESKESYAEIIDQRANGGWYLIDKQGNYRGPATSKNIHQKIKELLAE